MSYCLVDYACPEHCGDWLRERYPQAMIETVGSAKYFNKSRAHNLGARRAIAEGFEYLCFLDADTVIHQDFVAYVYDVLAPDRFLIAESSNPNLCGVLVVAATQFQRVGGFDVTYEGWGHEDVDLRLRLRLQAGLSFVEIPDQYVTALSHPDSLRTQHYAVKDTKVSSNRQAMKLIIKLRAMTDDPTILRRPDIMKLLRVKKWTYKPGRRKPPPAS